MISSDLRAHIRRLFYAEHWKVGTIAAELGVHRDTVALAIEAERFTNVAYRPTAAVLDPYKDFVRATLEQHPRLRATRLLEMIQGRGYSGSVWPLRRFVRVARPGGAHEAFFRLSMLPGEQGQVDWGSFGSIAIGHSRRWLSCFVMVLSFSRALFARFVLDQTLESFLRCHHAAFVAFRGVPRGLHLLPPPTAPYAPPPIPFVNSWFPEMRMRNVMSHGGLVTRTGVMRQRTHRLTGMSAEDIRTFVIVGVIEGAETAMLVDCVGIVVKSDSSLIGDVS
jgi:hypothetical protein